MLSKEKRKREGEEGRNWEKRLLFELDERELTVLFEVEEGNSEEEHSGRIHIQRWQKAHHQSANEVEESDERRKKRAVEQSTKETEN
jgi:hypothetical protein